MTPRSPRFYRLFSRWTWVSWYQQKSSFWISLELRIMEMVVITTAIQHAELQSNCHQQTNTQILQDGCLSCCPTNGVKHKCNSETTYLCLLLLRDRLRRRLCGRRGTSRLHNTNTIASTHAVLYRTITLINSFMVLIPEQPR